MQTEIDELDAILDELVAETAPELIATVGVGVGVDTASALMVAAGDNLQRLRSEATFAHLCGVAPIPASSGQHQRHRLNRGGDRQANAALWRIVITRMVCDPGTRAYIDRRELCTFHPRRAAARPTRVPRSPHWRSGMLLAR